MGGGIDLGHGQAFDIVAAPGKQADDTGQHAGLVVDQHGDGVAFAGGTARILLVQHQTSILPSSETPTSSSSPRIISLCAAPDGIIGKIFSAGSTRQSNSTGRLVLIISRMAPSTSDGLVAR